MEYTDEGKQVREIRFDSSIKSAHQTVQLTIGQFIVTHGDGTRPHSLNRVCMINAEGQIIKWYGRELGDDDDQLNIPYSVTINSNAKHIIVADCFNNKLKYFDSDLTFLGLVQASSDLDWPHRFFFDSQTDRLFVGEYRSGRILVINHPT